MGTTDAPDLLPGTLDLLILNRLVRGPMHSYAVAQRLRTAAGRKQLTVERQEFDRFILAIRKVLNTA